MSIVNRSCSVSINSKEVVARVVVDPVYTDRYNIFKVVVEFEYKLYTMHSDTITLLPPPMHVNTGPR